MPTDAPIPIRIAQTLGITASALLAGNTLSLSFFTIPRLLESPTPLMLRQWKTMFIAGKHVSTPAFIFSSLCYFYLSYRTHSPSSPFVSSASSRSYFAAGVLAIGILGWTFAVQMPTNVKLLDKVEQTKTLGKEDVLVEAGLGEESAHYLVDRWGLLNVGRGVMLVGSTVLGIWTAVSS